MECGQKNLYRRGRTGKMQKSGWSVFGAVRNGGYCSCWCRQIRFCDAEILYADAWFWGRWNLYAYSSHFSLYSQFTPVTAVVKNAMFLPLSFSKIIFYTDSRALFEGLWQEWLDMKLYLMAKGTPLLEKGYKGVFESLPEEKQSILIGRKADFAIYIHQIFTLLILPIFHFTHNSHPLLLLQKMPFVLPECVPILSIDELREIEARVMQLA